MEPSKKTYFASDFHLGMNDDSPEREKKIVRWLDEIKNDARAIYLVGDIFDFWFEYKKAIPKGFIRLQGKLAELSDMGIKIFLFTGNHDVWMFDYFVKEMNIPVYNESISTTINNKKFYISHGDGLEPGWSPFKIIKWIFNNQFCQWVFSKIHPNLGISFAQVWSKHSRNKNDSKGERFFGDKEWSFQFAKEIEEKEHHDFYLFGHRHLPMDMNINETSRFICLGDWIKNYTYAVFDGVELELIKYEE